MQEFIRAGVDLAKDYFQVHALNSKDEQATARKLSRQAMQKFFAETRPCLAGMEARASAPRAGRRDWAGALIAIGRDVPLIPPIFVKPCGKRVKTMPPARKRSSRGHVAPRHASPVNSEEQQAGLMPDKTRAGLDQATDDERQRLVRSSCGVRPCRSKGIGRGDALIAKAATDAALAGIAKAALTGVAGHPETIAARITEGGARIARAHPQSPVSRLPAGIPGSRKIAAAAIAASAPNPWVFKSGRAFARRATPRQNASGGKTLRRLFAHQRHLMRFARELGSIPKQGNRSIRRLHVLGEAIARGREFVDRLGLLERLGLASRQRPPDAALQVLDPVLSLLG